MGKLWFVVLIVGIVRSADFYCFEMPVSYDPLFPHSYIVNYQYRVVSHFCNTSVFNVYSNPRLVLHLQNFTMSKIVEGQFNSRTQVIGMFLSNLNIERVVPGAFNYQSNIKIIYMDHNAISVITHGIFNSLTNLLTLDLSFNKIETISDDAFVGTKLESLNLNNNRLKSFLNDYILGTVDKLMYLYLGFNDITSVDSDMSNSSVTNLTLSNNKIDFINVTLLPRNLTMVDFSFNEISEVEHMGSLKSREILLNSNALSSFKVNNVTEIFDISENHIQYLDNDLLGKNLKVLKVANNNISEISSSCFHNLSNLFHLDLSHNNLSQISLGTFDSLNSLNVLNISYNHLIEFPVHQLNSLGNLRFLYVQNNEINNVNVEESMKHLPRLREVNLKNNSWFCKNLLGFIYVLKEKGVKFNNDEKVDSSHSYGIICNKQDESSNVLEDRDGGSEKSNLFKYLDTVNKQLQNLNSNINSGIKLNQEIVKKELQSLNNNLNSGIKQFNQRFEQEQESILKSQDKSNQFLEILIKKLYENVTISTQNWNFSKPFNDKLVASEFQKTSSSNEVFNAFCIIMLLTIVVFLAIMGYLFKTRLLKPPARSELNLMQHLESDE